MWQPNTSHSLLYSFDCTFKICHFLRFIVILQILQVARLLGLRGAVLTHVRGSITHGSKEDATSMLAAANCLFRLEGINRIMNRIRTYFFKGVCDQINLRLSPLVAI